MAEENANLNQENSEIFVVRNTNGTAGGLKRLIKLMAEQGLSFYAREDQSGLIARDDLVLLEINCQWDERGGTNTDLIKAVIQAIVDHPAGFNGEIVVADNGQKQYGAKGNGGSLDWESNNAVNKEQSVQDVIDEFSSRYRVSGFLWDDITYNRVAEYQEGDLENGFVILLERDAETDIPVSYPKFQTAYGTYVSFKEGIWNEKAGKYEPEKLKVLNMPVLKTHRIYGATASVKNYMGTTSDLLTEHKAHNSVGTGGMGTQLAETRMPVLNILDAIWVNNKPGQGPRTSYDLAEEKDIILAGIDPVALDYWAVKNILVSDNINQTDRTFQTLNPDGDSPGSFGYWLGLSRDEIQRAGHFSTMDENKIEVYEDK